MNKKIPKISIIILNFNAGEFLEKCLLSLEKCFKEDSRKERRYEIADILIVDNGSSDNSLKLAEKSAARLRAKVIRNNKNIGFAAGNNIAVKNNLDKNANYVLFLNPDTIVFPGVLPEVVSFMEERRDAGVATCRVELPNGHLDEACHRGFPTPWRSLCFFSRLSRIFGGSRLFSGYTLGHLVDLETPHEIDSCSGSFLLVRRSVGEKIGWWDEDYFFYGEDLDFCFRVKEHGFNIYYLPRIKIVHFRGIASGIKSHSKDMSKASKETKLTSALASVEAMRIFYRKHLQKRYKWPIGLFVFGGIKLLEMSRVWKIKIKEP